MTIIRVRLDDEDRKRYGTDVDLLPEELVLDVEALKDLPAAELEQVERDSELSLAGLIPHVEPRLSSLAVIRRAVAYLAVRQAGYQLDYDGFQPRLLRATFTQEDAGDPPAGPSEGSSED